MEMPRPMLVENKTPAPVQITTEQILREARELQEPQMFQPPKQEWKHSDAEELTEYRLRKRKEYEDLIRRARHSSHVWVKYTQWEESQQDFARARSIWERAIEVNYMNSTFWLKYGEMEMKHKFVNHARNVWNRAVSLLPRIEHLWYKYIHMEEMLGNVAGARQIFDRWMTWEPDHHGWDAYIKFELRNKEINRARAVYDRYVECHPGDKAWIQYAKFEVTNGNIDEAKQCYERALVQLGQDGQTEEIFVAFAQFLERYKELKCAREIYQYCLDHMAESSYQRFVEFEKQYEDREGIENAIVGRRRLHYEAEVKKNPLNYDLWFDYACLEESEGDKEKVREVYERALVNVPLMEQKRYWKLYIYLWINYALYEELEAGEYNRTRHIFMACLHIIPHAKFTFAKFTFAIMAAEFEIRQKNLITAGTILSTAIGSAPKDKLFKTYIEMELQLGNINGCRTLYEKYLEWAPSKCCTWRNYAELERSVAKATKSSSEQARSIFEFAVTQPLLDMPEVLWKDYIEFEISEGEYIRTRQLYERVLHRTEDVEVWISYAEFEATMPLDTHKEGRELDMAKVAEARVVRTRGVFERAYESLRTGGNEERAMLLEEWIETERSFGEFGDLAAVQRKLPLKVKRKHPVIAEDGTRAGYEEYNDYIFPDEMDIASNLEISEAAHQWKRQKAG